MKFKKVFRGYDPKEVDKHLNETAIKEQQIRAAQKERIDELLEENRGLRQLVAQYQADEQAISKSLIVSQNLAENVRHEADKYSELVFNRAKIFCASWRAYSRTLVASLSDEEVREFNFLQRKIENMIYAYNGDEVKEAAATEAMSGYSNPIEKVEEASEQVIDLTELTNPKQSLEEICADLGLTSRNTPRRQCE